MGRTVAGKNTLVSDTALVLFANPFGGYSIRKAITRRSSRSPGAAAKSGRFESYVTQPGAV
jgi:hypothetical protein